MKIFERLVHNQLYTCLSENEPNQLGFRPQHSTQTTLGEVSDHILKEIDAGRLVGGIFIDLKKTFDKVSHAVLLNKLSLFGVKGLELDWFGSYLNDRKQATKFANTISSFECVWCSVPQGSILGPLHFYSQCMILMISRMLIQKEQKSTCMQMILLFSTLVKTFVTLLTITSM